MSDWFPRTMPSNVFIAIACAQFFIGLMVGLRCRGWRWGFGRRALGRARLLRMSVVLRRVAQQCADDLNQHRDELSDCDAGLRQEGKRPEEHHARIVGILERLLESNARLESRLAQAEQELLFRAKKLDWRPDKQLDPLTRMLSREGLLARNADTQARFHSPHCVIVLSVDDLRALHARHGRLCGDHVMRTLARALREQAADEAVLARTGEDCFSILVGGDLQEAVRTGERLRLALSEIDFPWEKLALRVTLSCGVAEIERGSLESSLAAAETAVGSAQAGGGNRSCVHDALAAWQGGPGPWEAFRQGESPEFMSVCAALRERFHEVCAQD